jgi:hypothetical protein
MPQQRHRDHTGASATRQCRIAIDALPAPAPVTNEALRKAHEATTRRQERLAQQPKTRSSKTRKRRSQLRRTLPLP